MNVARLRGARGVWVLSALMVATVAAIMGSALPALSPVEVPNRLPWWALAIAFAVAELGAAQLHLRRSSHASTAGDLVLVLGLVLAVPADLVLAQAVGALGGLAWRRTPATLAFDAGRSALGAAVAALVFHSVAPGASVLETGTWLAVLAAVLAGAGCRLTLLAGAISVAESRVPWSEIGKLARLEALVSLPMTSVGLATATLVTLDAHSAWLLVVPGVMLMVAYRAYLAERQQRERLDFLYEATHALLVSADVEESLLSVVTRGRGAFRADLAEAVLLSPAGTTPRRTRVSEAGTEAMAPFDPEGARALRDLAAAGGGARRIERPAADPALERYLVQAGARGPVAIAVVAGEQRPLGVLLFANRPDAAPDFRGSDLELLERLAEQAAASLAHETLEEDFGRLEQLQSRLEHMAFHDPLTGLANRARFTEQVSDALARGDALVAALFIDLDDFKDVNDTLGHEAGDDLLQAVAGRLRACLRPQDTPARLGGDEFAVLLEHEGSVRQVLELAHRVLHALQAPFLVAGAEVAVGASIGVATTHDRRSSAEDLIRDADLAMYRAKTRGKGSVQCFEPGMQANAIERHELREELQRAVEEGQFVVLYQPVVDLRGGQIAGVEALVRWQHPRHGLIAPDQFIPLAEEAGVISAIGRHVTAAACRRLARWREASIAGDAFSLNINLSVREFQSPDLVDQLREAAVAAGVPTSSICLEIKESALEEDLERGLARMRAIKAAGFRLALDDFGTGYSSLGHLRNLPIDVLKVAKPFVDHIADRPQDAAFLRSILELARTLSLEVIVEGVETPEQGRLLLGMGALRVQGFVFSRPVVDRELTALLTLTPLQGFAAEAVAVSPAALEPASPR